MIFYYLVTSLFSFAIVFLTTMYLLKKGGINNHLLALLIMLPFAVFNLSSFENVYIPIFDIDTSDNDFLFYFSGVVGYLYGVPYMIGYRLYARSKFWQ